MSIGKIPEEYEKQKIEAVAALLAEFSKYMDIGDMGDSMMIRKTINIIETYFSAMTMETLYRAFDMAIAGKLHTTMDHYGKLTPRYVSHVLNAYREAVPYVQNHVPDPPEDDYADVLRKSKPFILDTYQEYLKTGSFKFRDYSRMHQIITDLEMMDLPDEIRSRIRKAVKEEFNGPDNTRSNGPMNDVIGRLIRENRFSSRKTQARIHKLEIIELFKYWKSK